MSSHIRDRVHWASEAFLSPQLRNIEFSQHVQVLPFVVLAMLASGLVEPSFRERCARAIDLAIIVCIAENDLIWAYANYAAILLMESNVEAWTATFPTLPRNPQWREAGEERSRYLA